ncbi:hypothetical protein CASFOL_027985 [Castilleja foliolosa]|uniref:Uncharacterized protein n=1 Tax=Castilleja foliolosa TaxID=1961234 RepID=A0ABD3CI69_9LAMI
MSPPSISAAPPVATAPPLSSPTPSHKTQLPLHRRSPFSRPRTYPFLLKSSKISVNGGPASRVLLSPPHALASREFNVTNMYDPELRSVLQLATDSDLYELEKILFGPSYFSPLLKSIIKNAEIDHIMIGEDPDERDDFISRLESRFLFLAADAQSTLRGWRPSYKKVLIGVKKKLKVQCSSKISAEDLEVEIFLHLLQEYSSEESRQISISKNADGSNALELGLNLWKVQKLAALGIGATELSSTIMKGGGMLTLEKMLELLGGRLSRKMLSEAAQYQLKKEAIKKGGQLVGINLESGLALLAARQGLKSAATRYLGLRGMTQLLGPLMWGTLLADVVIQMLGTDYARILRAVYALAQFEYIDLTKRHRTVCEEGVGVYFFCSLQL